MALRLAGKNYREIAEELGYGHAQAHADVWAVLDATDAATEDDAARLRKIELAQLDQLWHALWGQAVVDQDPKAIDRLIRISESRRRLLGLDAPARSEVSGPDGGAIDVDHRAGLRDALARAAGGIEPSSAG